jgi:O-antigen ligase
MAERRAALAPFLHARAPEAAARRWTTWLAAGVLAALPVLSLYAPRSLPGLAVLLAVAMLWPRPGLGTRLTAQRRAIVAATLAFAGFAAVSVLWSIDASSGAVAATKLVGWAALVTALVARWRPPADGEADVAGTALLCGFAAALVLLAIDLGSNLALLRLTRVGHAATEPLYAYSLNRGATVLAVLAWPVVALCAARWRAWTACLASVASGAVLLQGSSAAALLALIAAAAAWLLAQWLGRRFLRVIGAAMVLWLLAAPFWLVALAGNAWLAERVPQMAPAEIHRLLIWEFAAERIAERPVLGWGLNSARHIPGGRANLSDRVAERAAAASDIWHKRSLRAGRFEAMPLHPHSLALQLWLELGGIGALLAAALVWLALDAAARLESATARAALAATAVSAFVIANLSYGAWQSWWMGALILAFTAARAVLPAPSAPATACQASRA